MFSALGKILKQPAFITQIRAQQTSSFTQQSVEKEREIDQSFFARWWIISISSAETRDQKRLSTVNLSLKDQKNPLTDSYYRRPL